MKAALLVRPGTVVVDEVPEPEPGPGEVRIAVGGVGLCGSDMAVYLGKWTPPAYPWIGGHEAFGSIEAVGEGVPAARVGERVVVEPNVPCGTCAQCAVGRTSACLHRQSIGMNRQGALAERLVVPAANAWPAPGVADQDLACLEPLAVVEAGLRRLGAPAPRRSLVVGTGSQGLLMSLALLTRGSSVLVHDVSPDRVAVATGLGAEPLDPGGEPAEAELVVLTVGLPETMTLAVRHAAIGATILVLGLEDAPLEVVSRVLVRRQLVIRGSLTYDHPGDFAATVERVRSGAIRPGAVISDAYPLDEAPRAIEASRAARGKTWIRVGAPG